MTIGKNETILPAPRSVSVFLVQYMSIVPLSAVLGLTSVLFLFTPNKSRDIIIFMFLILFFLVAGIVLLYFPETYRTSCVYDKPNKSLRKVKKDRDTLTCDLHGVTNILIRIIKEDIGVRIEIALEEPAGKTELYREKNYCDRIQWAAFAKELSEATSLPLKEDFQLFS